MDITKMGLRRLRLRYGESNGKDREAEQELQRRGLNSKQLREVVWEYGGIKWGLAKSRANEIAARRKRRVRNQKNRRHRERRMERRRQEQRDVTARVEAGFVVTGERFDPSACDGSCPFGSEGGS